MLKNEIDKIIDLAIKEDVPRGDITTNVLISPQATSQAYIITREKAVICGLDIVQKIFKKLDPRIKVHTFYKNGDRVPKNAKVALIKGKTRPILAGERVALNFLSHLSAIATKTRQFVKAIYPYKAQIIDTRKTTPGLRLLEKKAVLCGEGINHRFNLSDMVLIKDNHRMKCSQEYSLQDLVKHAKKVTRKSVGIEVENLKQFQDALESHPDIILLDNMSIAQIKKAVQIKEKRKVKKKIKLEVSGNVNLKNVRAIAKTGVDRISIGALTHTKKAIDVSLELIS